MPILDEFIHAIRESTAYKSQFSTRSHFTNVKIATAELEPITETYVQSDEGRRYNYKKKGS